MKHFLFLFLISFYIPTFSQPSSLLWKIEAPHLEKPSYLYGTMHSRDKRAHLFGDSVLVKFDECDAVALEVLTGDLMENPFAMVSAIVMQDTTLDMLLNEEDYQKVKAFASSKLGVFGMAVDNIMPIFTSSLILEMSMRTDVENTVDAFFEQRAEEKGKAAIGIETFQEQINALKEISLKEQAQLLVEQLGNMKKDSLMFEELMNHYMEQNLAAMYKIYTDEDMPEMFDEALVVKRNHTMAERIDSFIREEPTFIAVGALHLPGDEGLIELLKKSGYKVEPVFSNHSGKD